MIGEISFGVGAAKTGTHSLATMFEDRIRAAHEPESDKLIRLVLQRYANAMSEADFGREVVSLFARQNLDFNVSQINGFIISTIFGAFPQSRYVLSVRGAAAWLRSFVNHQISRPIPSASEWQAFRDLRFLRAFRADRPEDYPLRSRNLYSLDAYLGYWAEHTATVVDVVPSDQLCIVSTDRLTEDAPRVPVFLGVASDAAQPAKSHSNQGSYEHAPLDELDPAYLAERSQAYTELLLSHVRRKLSIDNMRLMEDALSATRGTYFSTMDPSARQSITRDTIAKRATAVERWANIAAESSARWNLRAKLAASLIPDQQTVADLGCGLMDLERHLGPTATYIPVDVVRRDPRTVVVDLNAAELPKLNASCVVGLGLLEYLHDIPKFLSKVARYYEVAVFSYSPTEVVTSLEDRLAGGWVNNYSVLDLENEFARAGLAIKEKTRFDQGPWIWRLHRVDG